MTYGNRSVAPEPSITARGVILNKQKVLQVPTACLEQRVRLWRHCDTCLRIIINLVRLAKCTERGSPLSCVQSNSTCQNPSLNFYIRSNGLHGEAGQLPSWHLENVSFGQERITAWNDGVGIVWMEISFPRTTPRPPLSRDGTQKRMYSCWEPEVFKNLFILGNTNWTFF